MIKTKSQVDEETREMFEALKYAKISLKGRDFVDSLYDQWERAKSLSEKQMNALRKFYEGIGNETHRK